DDQISPAVVKDRYGRLVDLVNEIAWEENQRLVGRSVELMVAEGEGRKDAATLRLSGRGRDNRLVHFAAPDQPVRPGDLVTVDITYAAPHHLVADGPATVRRTRSGDAWEARQASPAGPGAGVTLGMPSLGVPAPLPDAPACR
ncbi:MAG: tRNA (N6-isopentenyl adenosine(37)-C2)-methylthiotransferase MiaB, partial [Nocardioides sp.]